MFIKWSQQKDKWRFYATSNEIIELDARSEKQILDYSANEILELDCEFNKQILVPNQK